MRRPRIAIATVAATLGLTLAACGGEEDTTGDAAAQTPSSSSSEQSAPSETASSSPAADDAASAEVTPPGTELSVGETATVPFTYGTEKSGTIAITVTAIEQGDPADLAAFGERANGLVPYFIRIKVENVGGTDLSYSSVSLRALGEDGRGTGVVITGDVEGKCESTSADDTFSAAGATFESCTLQAAQEGVAVTGAEFGDSEEYSDNPIVWTA
ncbi:hypothetical protein [Prauserella flavalba]|uniref:Lipoprotein n=1 Tax=Prauserella flavalba TaxID=1477506 RepID=A0A318LCK8_9PSEU|nr:hypothetical protein [Prauserella flavalba]PXY17641.1 hypothetical protein BA062_37185 [Prauserella flavalba]PXY21599.1 hypothetical protein BA062_32355 [Prauserella flavalba]